jgi:hypothetical protein
MKSACKDGPFRIAKYPINAYGQKRDKISYFEDRNLFLARLEMKPWCLMRGRLDMETRTPAKNAPAKQRDFLRQTLHSDVLEGVLNIPESLKHRMLEVILLPVEDGSEYPSDADEPSFLRRFAGAWAGAPLVREDQGEYETREALK